ncbi:sodium/proline symporter PutP [Limibacillus halophilus]|uniref:Sodium/proline symporter n=1 Tax=Limibacillus halophilus TaxID=1579333 RepID=A0A839SWT6_9PROT|nr:sodium/proline symporter PutP [Limibacillus halophilus]MBB3066150.1 sodium/proline symporter [Limibacillus halophilus]
MSGMSFPALITFGAYLALMVFIGIYCYRSTNTLGDFILGGRRLNSTTAALSAHASDSSGWLLLGLPGWAYAAGLDAVWMIFGLAVGIYLSWKFLAARLRVYTEQANDALTISAFFEYRFEDRTRVLRIFSAIIILIFYTLYVSSGLVAGGLLFGEVFGVEFTTAVALSVAVVVVYTFIGGFLAVSYTDVVQGLLMVFALVVVPLIAVFAVGGFSNLVEGIEAREPTLLALGSQTSFDAVSGTWSAGGTFGLIAIVSSMAWGLGYFGQPHILARFMGIRSPEQIPAARRIGMTWVLVSMFGALLVGLAGIVYFETPLDDPEKVFLALTGAVMNPWIGGIMLAAVLAAIMSTADSQLLVTSSALTEDIYRALLNRNASQNQLVWIGRALIVVVALIAFILALQGGSVLGLVGYAWAGFGAAFGPLILISLYWKGVTRNGALVGMLSGAIAVVAWKQMGTPFGLYEMVPAFFLSGILVFAVSKITKASLPSEQAITHVGSSDAVRAS